MNKIINKKYILLTAFFFIIILFSLEKNVNAAEESFSGTYKTINNEEKNLVTRRSVAVQATQGHYSVDDYKISAKIPHKTIYIRNYDIWASEDNPIYTNSPITIKQYLKMDIYGLDKINSMKESNLDNWTKCTINGETYDFGWGYNSSEMDFVINVDKVDGFWNNGADVTIEIVPKMALGQMSVLYVVYDNDESYIIKITIHDVQDGDKEYAKREAERILHIGGGMYVNNQKVDEPTNYSDDELTASAQLMMERVYIGENPLRILPKHEQMMSPGKFIKDEAGKVTGFEPSGWIRRWSWVDSSKWAKDDGLKKLLDQAGLSGVKRCTIEDQPMIQRDYLTFYVCSYTFYYVPWENAIFATYKTERQEQYKPEISTSEELQNNIDGRVENAVKRYELGGLYTGESRDRVPFIDVLSDTNKYTPSDISPLEANEVEKKISLVLTIITNIGMILAVLMSAIIGIKYMIGSVDEKAEYKKDLIPYLVGAFLLFGISAVVGVIQKWGTTINKL